jgi:hypothetical protein
VKERVIGVIAGNDCSTSKLRFQELQHVEIAAFGSDEEVTLTSEARAIHQSVQHEVGRLSKVAVTGLGAEELCNLVALLQKVRSNLEKRLHAGSAPTNVPYDDGSKAPMQF